MNIKDVWVKDGSPYRPSMSFLRGLYRLDDGRLRLRWSQRFHRWDVERKVERAVQYISTIEPYIKVRQSDKLVEVPNDNWTRARDGYILLGSYDPQPQPGDLQLRYLQYYDIRRWGGAQKVALATVREEERAAALQEEKQKADIHQLAVDGWDHFAWKMGSRVSVPSNYDY